MNKTDKIIISLKVKLDLMMQNIKDMKERLRELEDD